MLLKKWIGLASITPSYHDYRKSCILKDKMYSFQRLQIEYPDETELLKQSLDIFDDDIIDTLWKNSVYFIDWYHHMQ